MFDLLTVLWPSQDWREYCKKKAQWSWMWRTRVFTLARAKTPRFFNQFLLDNRVHSEYKVWFYDPEKQPRIQQNLMVGAKQHFLEPIHISWSLRVVMLGRLWNLPKLEIGRGVKLNSDKSRFQVNFTTKSLTGHFLQYTTLHFFGSKLKPRQSLAWGHNIGAILISSVTGACVSSSL